MNFPFKIPSRYLPEAHRLEGGQGYVYVLRDSYLDRDVAIKVMNYDPGNTRIISELAAISSVRSRHVAEVFDVVQARRSGQLGLVQEYVSGERLDRISIEPFTEGYWKILWQIASGLSDIHHHGVIHRDLKPANVRLDAEGVVKILDFGLSHVEKEAETKNARGTLDYRAPELYKTPPIRFTGAVDVYAFGVTAWHLASEGKLHSAFRETPPGSRQSMPSFQTLAASGATEILDLLDSSISLDPNSRPHISQIRDALQRQILFGKHRALIVHSGQRSELTEPGMEATLRRGHDSITIEYTGIHFVVKNCYGDCYINNTPQLEGRVLPGSCVITLGPPSQGSARVFITFDTSHPGVVI